MKKAQVMVFVLFITGVIAVISGALTIMWESEMKTRSSEREGLIAFYLAQAAVERGKILVLCDVGFVGSPNNNAVPQLYTSAGAYQFFYDIIITNPSPSSPPLGPASRRIEGIGRVLNSAGMEIARREIQVDVTGIVDSVPPVLQDDDLTGSVVAGSWQEN